MAEQELEEAGVPRWNTMMNNAELRTCELWSDNTGTVRLKPIFTSNLHDAKGKRHICLTLHQADILAVFHHVRRSVVGQSSQ